MCKVYYTIQAIMTFTEFILGALEGKSGHYSMILRMLTEPTAPVRNRKNKTIDQRSFSATIFRLQKQGLIHRDQSGAIKLLQKGRERLKFLQKQKNLPTHTSRFGEHGAPPSVIVLYDVPETLRRGRDWLRAELISLNFRLLQKSAWIGAGPLPKEFPARLQELGIFKYVHILMIQKRGTLIQ